MRLLGSSGFRKRDQKKECAGKLFLVVWIPVSVYGQPDHNVSDSGKPFSQIVTLYAERVSLSGSSRCVALYDEENGPDRIFLI